MSDAVPTWKLHELIKSVATKLGDAIEFSATGGTTSTLIDTLNIPLGNKDLDRRQLLITSGTYEGEARIITDTNLSTSTITFSPVLAGAIVSGVTAFCVNARGGGFALLEYKTHINMAIRDSYPIARTPVVSSNLTVDSSVPTLAVPSTMNEVWGVEYLDADGVSWRAVQPAGLRGLDGWHVNQAEGVLTLDPDTAAYYHGTTVRLRGEGRHAELTTFTSTTSLNAQWITSQAAYTLAMMGIDRDIHGSRARQVLQFQQDAQAQLALIRTRHEPTSIAVRHD